MSSLGDTLAMELGYKGEMVLSHSAVWEIIDRVRVLESTVSKMITVLEATRQSVCDSKCGSTHNSDCETLRAALKLAKGVL